MNRSFFIVLRLLFLLSLSSFCWAAPTTIVTWDTNRFYVNAQGAIDVKPGITLSVTATNLSHADLPMPGNVPATGRRLVATGAAGTAWISGYLTNVNYVRPDFNVPYSELVTNAAFVFLAPTNVLTTNYQACAISVTNINSGSAVAITAPTNVHTTGTWYVTNLTIVSFFNWAGRLTNAVAYPIY